MDTQNNTKLTGSTETGEDSADGTGKKMKTLIKRAKTLVMGKFKKPVIRQYGLLYFDHLRGERMVMGRKELLSENIDFYSAIEEKRDNDTLTWDDIYAYQLMLLENEDEEALKNRIISLRIKYQNLVDIADYNNYMTMRGVKLTEPNPETVKSKLQADCKFLLDEFYLRYAYASTYEELRSRILWIVGVCILICLICAVIFGTLTVDNGAFFKTVDGTFKQGYEFVKQILQLKRHFSTLFIVIFAGVIGAFVSIQQRFQSASRQGDPVYNLALLTHGRFSIFLSPLSGAIFAALLYLFFAGGLLSGNIFPKVGNEEKGKDQATQSPGTANPNFRLREKPEISAYQPAQSPGAANPAPTASPTPEDDGNIGLTDFATATGPRTNGNFALLVIWSFVAGFAERFVPDTLMRLVNQRKGGDANPT